MTKQEALGGDQHKSSKTRRLWKRMEYDICMYVSWQHFVHDFHSQWDYHCLKKKASALRVMASSSERNSITLVRFIMQQESTPPRIVLPTLSVLCDNRRQWDTLSIMTRWCAWSSHALKLWTTPHIGKPIQKQKSIHIRLAVVHTTVIYPLLRLLLTDVARKIPQPRHEVALQRICTLVVLRCWVVVLTTVAEHPLDVGHEQLHVVVLTCSHLVANCL